MGCSTIWGVIIIINITCLCCVWLSLCLFVYIYICEYVCVCVCVYDWHMFARLFVCVRTVLFLWFEVTCSVECAQCVLVCTDVIQHWLDGGDRWLWLWTVVCCANKYFTCWFLLESVKVFKLSLLLCTVCFCCFHFCVENSVADSLFSCVIY